MAAPDLHVKNRLMNRGWAKIPLRASLVNENLKRQTVNRHYGP